VCFELKLPEKKPCPQCREKNRLCVITDNTLFSGCYRQVQCCACGTRGGHGDLDNRAIERWNHLPRGEK
jgi:hypothetical protein